MFTELRCYAPMSGHLHLARKRTVFIYCMLLHQLYCMYCIYILYTVLYTHMIWVEIYKWSGAEAHRIYCTYCIYCIYSTVHRHDWCTVHKVEMMRSYFRTSSSGAQAHRVYILYTVYTAQYCKWISWRRWREDRPGWMGKTTYCIVYEYTVYTVYTVDRSCCVGLPCCIGWSSPTANFPDIAHSSTTVKE